MRAELIWRKRFSRLRCEMPAKSADSFSEDRETAGTRMFLRFLFSARLNLPLLLRGFYGIGVGSKIFHAEEPNHAGGENYSRHKQKRHMHVCVTADVTKQPERLHVAQGVDDENVCGKCSRAHGRQRDVRQRGV